MVLNFVGRDTNRSRASSLGSSTLGTRPIASARKKVLENALPTAVGMQKQLIWWNCKHTVQKGMALRDHLPFTDLRSEKPPFRFAPEELPLTVRDAAAYLGVSVQTVYLWVERKQIPHLRVMGRNIRFLRSDLEPFRATFKQEMGHGAT